MTGFRIDSFDGGKGARDWIPISVRQKKKKKIYKYLNQLSASLLKSNKPGTKTPLDKTNEKNTSQRLRL